MQRFNRYKKQHQKDRQPTQYFDKLCRKSLQDNLIDKNYYECLSNVFTKYLDETKSESFL